MNPAETFIANAATQRYAKCIAASRRIRWDIDLDVFRGRLPDFAQKFMPDSLSRANEPGFLRESDRRFLSQVQGRTYANMFALVERFVGAKLLELTKHYWLGDQVALEALVRFTDEELKHQELFRRLDSMAAAGMPPGYAFKPRANDVAEVVLGKSTWAVLALTLDIELLTLAHYRSSIEPDPNLSSLWKDVFLYHWKEESQHAVIDELEWRREDARLTPAGRDRGVDELVQLIATIDVTLQKQAACDADYFLAAAGRAFNAAEQEAIHCLMLAAYREQYIATGVREPRFIEVLRSLVTPAQMERFGRGLPQ